MTTERVLVTGATGLVGHGIRVALEEARKRGLTGGIYDAEYTFANSKDADLRNADETMTLFDKVKPTRVIHLAARVGGLFANMADPIGFFNDNMLMNLNVTKACHSHSVKKGIFCLSTCILPADAPVPYKEYMLHDGPPHPSNEGYAYAKRMLEVICRHYNEQFGYDWVCVIPTNLYGPHDNYNLSDGHVLPALIHKMYVAKRDKQPMTVSGSGKPLRQFLYAKDAGRFFLDILQADKASKPFSSVILAPSEEDEVSISDLTKMVATAMDFDGPIVYDTSKADGIFRKAACNEVLKKFIGDSFYTTKLEVGVKESVEWFINNYETARK